MSYQQEPLPANDPRVKKFHGWRFGGDLEDAQAELLEPVVDVMTEMLQTALLLPPEWDRQKSQHELALALVEHTGAAAGLINDISMTLVTEQNPEEQLHQLNLKATQLRSLWLLVATIAAKAIVNLDATLNGD